MKDGRPFPGLPFFDGKTELFLFAAREGTAPDVIVCGKILY